MLLPGLRQLVESAPEHLVVDVHTPPPSGWVGHSYGVCANFGASEWGGQVLGEASARVDQRCRERTQN